MSGTSNRSLRARLSRTLVGLGLASVVLLATVNFVVVRTLLDTSVKDQLVTLRELRRDSIENGIERLLDRVAVIAQAPGLAGALVDLDGGYEAFESEPTRAQLDDLERAYEPVVGVYDDAGVERPAIDELLPASAAGRSVQYAYIAANPNEPSERAALDDAGDGSAYSAAHAANHDYLTGVAQSVGANDLLLVSAASGDVVYSVQKRIDLGTNVETGPYSETGLGEVWDALRGSAVNDAVVVDAEFYLPDASAPLVHIAATVRQDTAVVGAFVVEFPIDGLTDIVTAGGQWDLLGLGDTGDAYVVGPDRRLRTVPRAWFDDPDAYVDRYLDTGGDERTAGLMEFTASPVLLHEIDNDAVEAAIVGDEFIGGVDNGLDRSTLAAAAPLELPGLDWIVVTEQERSETRSELLRFLWSTLLLLAMLLPVLAIVGIVLARVFARPVGPLVGAAHAIADGDFDTEVDDLGRNELGDLGRQLERVAQQLREQDASIAAEEERIMAMLASVLPAPLVDRVRRGERDVAELVDSATVVVLSVDGLPDPSGAEQDAVLDLTERITDELDELCRAHDVERIRLASEQHLFVAGRGEDGERVDRALAFATTAVDRVTAVGTEFGIELAVRGGLSAGLVASGVLGRRQLAFGIWGDPVDRGIGLSELRGTGVFLDGSVADLLADDAAIRPVDDEGSAGADLGDVYTVEPAATWTGEDSGRRP